MVYGGCVRDDRADVVVSYAGAGSVVSSGKHGIC